MILPFLLYISAIASAYSARPLAIAEGTVDEKLPLVPLPKQAGFSSKRLELTGRFVYPAGLFLHSTDFIETLSKRFALSSLPGGTPVNFDGGLSDLKIAKEAFVIRIDTNGIHVFGQDEVGLQLGLRRLAMLAFSENGHLYLPMGSMTDWPRTPWRGFQFSVGPHARAFQTEFAARVLLPLGFDHAVLECERSAWETLPNVRGGLTMPLDELQKLFRWYRQNGIDGVPLVESLGRMEWLFTGGGNVALAVNLQAPATLDLTKPEAVALLGKLWDEVVEVTRAKAIHFGGEWVSAESPEAVTHLWTSALQAFLGIATKHGTEMMLWSDSMLGPGEAMDGMGAPTVEAAKARREVLPEGMTIMDRHLRSTADFSKFFPSLDLWQRAGMKTIAAGGSDPLSARAAAIAAVQRRCGVLQTTAPGESNASNPFQYFDDFASFILTCEYSWTGRQDDPGDLGYNYRDLFRKMWFQAPIRLVPASGVAVTDRNDGLEESVGRYRYVAMNPSQSVAVPAGAAGKRLVVFLSEEGMLKPGELAATLVVTLADGTVTKMPLNYGWQVRAKGDVAKEKDAAYCPGAEYAGGVFAVRVSLSGNARSVQIVPESDSTKVQMVGLDVLK